MATLFLVVAVPGLLALGFVPSHISLDFMGKALPGAAAPLDARPVAWVVSLGDTDFF